MAVTWCMPDVTALISSSSDEAPAGPSFGILAPRRLLSGRHSYTGRATRQEGSALARGPRVRDVAWRYRRRRFGLPESGGDPGRTPEPGAGGGCAWPYVGGFGITSFASITSCWCRGTWSAARILR